MRICIVLQEKNMPFSALLTETLAKALDSSIDSSLRSKVLTILFNIFNEETERDFVALTNVCVSHHFRVEYSITPTANSTYFSA